VLASFGQVQAPFGLSADMSATLTELGAVARTLDPTVAAATAHLVKLVLSFRSSAIQAVAMLPMLP